MSPPQGPLTAVFFASGLERRLELAIRADDGAQVAQLVAAGAGVNARGRRDVTPLMIAVDAQAPAAVAALLRAGALPNARASDGAGPVHLAVENHATRPHGRAILDMIMRGGGDPDTRRPDGDPILMRFVHDHDMDGLRWLRSLGADVDIRARTSRPVIADAAWGQSWDAVWCLIELGAKVDYEGTPYSLAQALDSPYAESPDAPMYPAKLKVWQYLGSRGIAVAPFVTPKRPGGP